MKIYLAGTSVSNPETEVTIARLFKRGHKLHSYFHCVNGFETKWFEMNTSKKVDLFIDSGGYSAWTQKVDINIQDYIQFIKDHSDAITAYANLDVIGDAKKTFENQRIMEKAGLHPIPVFHTREDFSWLERYLKRGYEYIALGGLTSSSNLISHLDKCFSNYICDDKGMPKVKVHGFGLTSFSLMFRYPWFSVDSTSWVITGRLGSIFVPVFRGGVFDYSKFPHKIALSSVSPTIKEAGRHISNLSPKQQDILLKYIKDMGYVLGKSTFRMVKQTYELKENEKWIGKKPKDKNTERMVETIRERGLANTYQLRDELNIKYYLELEKHMKPYPWSFKIKQDQKKLF